MNKQKWFPEPYQVFVRSGVFSSRSYLKSVSAALMIGVIGFPMLVWHGLIKPMFVAIFDVIVITTITLIAGFLGKLDTIDVSKEQAGVIGRAIQLGVKKRREMEEELIKQGLF